MSEELDTPILRMLFKIDANVDALRYDMRDVKQRMTNLGEGLAIASHRFDRLDERFARIEKRLEHMTAGGDSSS
jgi:hypothetical protein